MKTLNRYIARRIISGLLLAFLIVTSIIMLVDFVEGTRKFGSYDSVSALQVFTLTALKAPKLIEQTIPFVVLFGVMGTLYSLNRKSELIVLRACGLSAWRFLTPALIVTSTLGVMWSLAFNPLASKTETLQRSYAASLRGTTPMADQGPVWLREGTELGQTVIRADGFDVMSRKLMEAKFWIFEFDANGNARFSSRLDARDAVWSRGYWQLSDVIENSPDGIKTPNAFVSWPTTLRETDLMKVTQLHNVPAFWDLPEDIRKMRLAGFSTTSLVMQFHRLLALPLMLIAMTFIAAGVSMHLTREGGTFRLMIFGGVIGFAVFFIDNIVSAFGESGALPASLAAWTIPFFVLFCAVAYITKIEDG